MHFEVLVEDESGKKMLEVLMPKIIGKKHTCNVRGYKGIGKIPPNLKSSTDSRKRLLLAELLRLLGGFGKTFAKYPANYPAVVVVVCDLDKACLKKFRQELYAVLNACKSKPETRFCIAIEEGEAWLLGDIPAIKAAYPKAKANVLNNYKNDSICGTWELLADAIFTGGSRGLKKKPWYARGDEKCAWAQKITPYMNIERNASPSFCYFRDKIRELT